MDSNLVLSFCCQKTAFAHALKLTQFLSPTDLTKNTFT